MFVCLSLNKLKHTNYLWFTFISNLAVSSYCILKTELNDLDMEYISATSSEIVLGRSLLSSSILTSISRVFLRNIEWKAEPWWHYGSSVVISDKKNIGLAKHFFSAKCVCEIQKLKWYTYQHSLLLFSIISFLVIIFFYNIQLFLVDMLPILKPSSSPTNMSLIVISANLCWLGACWCSDHAPPPTSSPHPTRWTKHHISALQHSHSHQLLHVAAALHEVL